MSIRPGAFARGVRLEQNKEPAYSREIKRLPFPEGQQPRTLPQGPDGYTPAADLSALTPQQVIRLARLAGIVDENDGRPLWEKLEEAQKRSIYAVVVDAIDDEPYLSSQLNPMLKHGKEIVTALRLCARAVSASKQYVAVYKHLTDLSITIPRYVDDVRIKRIRGKYPAEFRSRYLFGEDRKVLLIGACALLFLYRAAAEGQAQSTAIVMGDRLIGEAPEYTLEQWLRCDPLWPHVFDAPAYAHLQSTLDAVQVMPDEENRFNALKAVFSQLMADATLTPLFNYHYRISAPPGVNGVRLTPRGWFEFTEAWLPAPSQ